MEGSKTVGHGQKEMKGESAEYATCSVELLKKCIILQQVKKAMVKKMVSVWYVCDPLDIRWENRKV